MPIVYRIDHDARLVVAAGYGVFTSSEIFDYQREVWSRPDVKGYDELIDMSRVTEIAMAEPHRMKELAALSAKSDSGSSRFAIVASEDLAYGLGRMYQAYRELNPKSTKTVGVFRTLKEALAYLEIDSAVAVPETP